MKKLAEVLRGTLILLAAACARDDDSDAMESDDCEIGTVGCTCNAGACVGALECTPILGDESRCRAPQVHCDPSDSNDMCVDVETLVRCEVVPLEEPFFGDETRYVERACTEICGERSETSYGCAFNPPADKENCWCGAEPDTFDFDACELDPYEYEANPCAPDQICDVGTGNTGVCAPFCESDQDCYGDNFCYGSRCRRECEPECP